MGLETGNVISDLVSTNPLGTDDKSQGDNHLRLIKTVLKHTFPGSAGDGYDEVIRASEQELNYLIDLTSNVQAQIDSINSDLQQVSDWWNNDGGSEINDRLDSIEARLDVIDNDWALIGPELAALYDQVQAMNTVVTSNTNRIIALENA